MSYECHLPAICRVFYLNVNWYYSVSTIFGVLFFFFHCSAPASNRQRTTQSAFYDWRQSAISMCADETARVCVFEWRACCLSVAAALPAPQQRSSSMDYGPLDGRKTTKPQRQNYTTAYDIVQTLHKNLCQAISEPESHLKDFICWEAPLPVSVMHVNCTLDDKFPWNDSNQCQNYAKWSWKKLYLKQGNRTGEDEAKGRKRSNYINPTSEKI